VTGARRKREPAVVGSESDTIDDRIDHTPAVRFEERSGLVWLVKADGARYAFAGPTALPGWLAYYRSMVDALERFLGPGAG
jgi:hypothetical protein